jgi:uncharacterized membrane protein YhhN
MLSPESWALLCVVLLVPLLWSEASAHDGVRATAKFGASVAFVAHAVSRGAWEGGPSGRLLVIALVLSLAGDVLLLWKDRTVFLGGLVAFLASHVVYAVTWASLGVDPRGFAGGAVLLAPVAWAIWAWVSPHAGRMKVAVGVYLVVIFGMVATTIARALAAPDLASAVLVGSALVFAASDVAVARDRFVAPGFQNRAAGLPLYYLAQLGLGGAGAVAVAQGG